MKKALKSILAIVCVASIFLAGGENADGSCDLVWSLCFLALATISGLAYGSLSEETKSNE